ncbi:nuclear transport factor 2 family protein [Dactylosporangium sp. CA-092794]|uniref:nuclear transport factor 2 family protein n=1 Tax=Dactylosporangium sp. CA-092794 TaxID=3239929 RepID=UPI003D8E864E
MTAGLRADIDAVMADWAYYIDHDDVDALMDLFTADARYVAGSASLHGKDEIAARYRARTRFGARSTRHVYSGLRLTEVTAASVRATSTWTCYAANEPAPVQRAAVYLVADFIDRLTYCDDATWRIAERTIVEVFREPSLAPVSGPA